MPLEKGNENLGPGTGLNQVDELIEEVAECLARRYKIHKIRSHLADVLGGPIKETALKTLVSRARQRLESRSTKPRSEHLALSIEFLEGMLADDDLSPIVKLKTLEQLNAMLGVGAKWTQQERDPGAEAAKIRSAIDEMSNSFSVDTTPGPRIEEE